jgi:hypothetical protein
MPTLEEQLASLLNEEQQRARPLTIEQQLAAFIAESQGRSTSFQRSRSFPVGSALTIEHQLASLLEQQQQQQQQQGRHQSFQATSSVTGMMSTYEQQLALMFQQQHDMFRAARSLPDRVWTVEQQLANLTQNHQGRGRDAFSAMGSLPATVEQQLANLTQNHQGRGRDAFSAMGSLPEEASGRGGFPAMDSLPEEAPTTIEQQLLAQLIREQRVNQDLAAAAASIHPPSLSRSTLLEEQYPSLLSPGHPQLLAQVQRDTSLQQQQASDSAVLGLDHGRAVHPLSLGSPPETRVPIPPSYGNIKRSPGNRYRILLEAERQGRDHADSSTHEVQGQQAIAAYSPRNTTSHDGLYRLADSDRRMSLEHHQLLAQQQHIRDTFLQASSYSYHDFPTHTPSLTATTATTILLPQPFARHGKSETFPGKLYRLMAHAEMVGDTHIVSFTPDGLSFKIHDTVAFMKDVSSNYFHQSQFLSFARQLNLYGFERILIGPNFGAYAHPSFQRGRPELLCDIKRTPAVPRAKRKKADAAVRTHET